MKRTRRLQVLGGTAVVAAGVIIAVVAGSGGTSPAGAVQLGAAPATSERPPPGWDTDTAPGRGYDLANGPYFSTVGLSPSPILDAGRLLADGKISYQAFNEQDSQVYAGRSIQEYARSVATGIGVSGSYGLFRASMKSSFGISAQVSSEDAFLTENVEVRKLEYDIAGGDDPASLRPYLTAPFKADVDDARVDPATLFQRYGTHLPVALVYGGRLSMNYLYENSAQQSTTDLTAEARAGFADISSSADAQTRDEAKDLEEHSSITIATVGGTKAIRTNSLEQAAASYPAWFDSILVSQPASLSFVGPPVPDAAISDWALPVWDFATDPTRARELETAFDAELQANAASFDAMQTAPEYVKDIYFGVDGKAELAVDGLEKRLPPASVHDQFTDRMWDLNSGSGGDFVYLGYTLTTDPSQAVTAIAIVDGGDPDHYSRNGVAYKAAGANLNSGTGGDDLWLFYTHDPAAAFKPGFLVGDIGLQSGKDQDAMATTSNIPVGIGDPQTAGSGWSTIGPDLNKGAGGNYIFLWYQLVPLPQAP